MVVFTKPYPVEIFSLASVIKSKKALTYLATSAGDKSKVDDACVLCAFCAFCAFCVLTSTKLVAKAKAGGSCRSLKFSAVQMKSSGKSCNSCTSCTSCFASLPRPPSAMEEGTSSSMDDVWM